MAEGQVVDAMLAGLGTARDAIGLIALTYSMGDGISRITPIRKVANRGITSREGAGVHIGGGTRVYDAIAASGIPAVVVPGIHRDNYGHPCFRVYSHGASPEKLGIAYSAHMAAGDDDFIVADISSNTVTMGVRGRRLLGAIDACIFAPGVHHGPLDLQAIRDVDLGRLTANDAFSTAGVTRTIPYKDLGSLQEALQRQDPEALWAFDAMAVFAAMEVASFLLLVPGAAVFTAGSVGSMDLVTNRMSGLLKKDVMVLGPMAAAIGLSWIARDVSAGKKDILGIAVED